MIKFNKEGIELIRNKIGSDELKNAGRLTRVNKHNYRKYDNGQDNIEII